MENFRLPMSLFNLATLPTRTDELRYKGSCHESLFQSWGMLELLNRLLQEGTPPHVALGILDAIYELSNNLKAEPVPDNKE